MTNDLSQEESNALLDAQKPKIQITPTEYTGKLPVQLTETNADAAMLIESVVGSGEEVVEGEVENIKNLPVYDLVEKDSTENTSGGTITKVGSYSAQDSKTGEEVDLKLYVYPVYNENLNKVVREYATYAEVKENNQVVDSGFYPVIVKDEKVKIASDKKIELPDLNVDDEGNLVVPVIVRDQKGNNVTDEQSEPVQQQGDEEKNDPNLIEDNPNVGINIMNDDNPVAVGDDENNAQETGDGENESVAQAEVPVIEPTYTDGAGNIVEEPVKAVEDEKIVEEILKSDDNQLKEMGDKGTITVDDTTHPLENDNHNAPNSGGLYIEPIIISMVATVYPDGENGTGAELVDPVEEPIVVEEPVVENSNSSSGSFYEVTEVEAPSGYFAPSSNSASSASNASTASANNVQSTPTATATPTPTPTPAPTPTPTPVPTPTPAPKGHYEQVWVVDVPAKVVEEPIYETRMAYVCNGCAYSTISAEDIGQHQVLHNLMDGTGYRYHSETTKVQTGTKKTTIPEQGHYEQKWVLD